MIYYICYFQLWGTDLKQFHNINTQDTLCVIVSGDSKEEYNKMNISNNIKQMKLHAIEQEWGISSIVRVPLFDEDKAHDKWMKVLSKYKENTRNFILFIDKKNTIKQPRDYLNIIKYIVREVFLSRMKIFIYETRSYIDNKTSADAWEKLLISNKRSRVLVSVKRALRLENSRIYEAYKQIDWYNDIIYLNSTFMSEHFPDIFPADGSFKVYLSRELEMGYIEIVKYYIYLNDKVHLYKYNPNNIEISDRYAYCLSGKTYHQTMIDLRIKYGKDTKAKRINVTKLASGKKLKGL